MKKINNVALYIRVSTIDQANFGYSISAQTKLLKEYAEQNSWTIYDTFIDSGISGKATNNRPALQKLLNEVKQGKFEMVLVWKINRLARNIIDLLEIADFLKKHQVSLQSITEQFDLSTPLGEFTLQMMAAVGELERKTIAENMQLGRQQRNRQGIYCGSKILGYETVTTNVHSKRRGTTEIKIVPSEARIVKHIFKMYADGFGYKAITNDLNKNGFRSKYNKHFSTNTIRTILNNVVYLGKIRYFDPKVQQEQILDGQHEPVIESQLWDKVQNRLCSKQRVVKIEQRAFPLTALLRCPDCQSSMIPFHTKGYRKDKDSVTYHYYICNQYQNKGIKACKPNSVPADRIERLVIDRIQQFITYPKLLEDIVDKINMKAINEVSSLQKKISQIDKKLKGLDRNRKNYFQLFEEEFIDKSTFVERIDSIKSQVKSFSDIRDQLENEISKALSKQIDFHKVESTIKHFEKLWHLASPDKQKQLLSALINKIILQKVDNSKSVNIHFNRDVLPYIIEGVMDTNLSLEGGHSI
ncbi:recombinase family protein [Niallia nealsonii]|nr:recombinase family protein [Niallia nealsonii]